MDFDHDGHIDIVSGGYMGVPHWIQGSETGFLEDAVILRNVDGGHLHTGRYWDPDTEEHTTKEIHGVIDGDRSYAALSVDWDGDGDYDLIRGTSKGALYLCLNKGTPSKAAFDSSLTPIQAGEAPAQIPGGYAIPVAADWDGDGLWDLITGDSEGGVWWLRNAGVADAPAFEPPVRLVENADTEGKGRGDKAQVEVADWDGDGDMDLLVGDCHLHYDTEAKTWDNHGYVWLYRRD